MTDEQRRAVEALFEIVSTAEPKLLCLRSWFFETVRTIDKWYNSESNQGVVRAKKILQAGWLAILNEETPVLDFVKTSMGIPSLVLPLVKRVKSLKLDTRLMSAVLSLVRVTDLWKGKPDEATIQQSLSVVADSRLPISARRVFKEYSAFLDQLLGGKYDSFRFVQEMKRSFTITSEPEFHHYTGSRGPNGVLIESAHLDIVTLRRCKTSKGTSLLEEVQALMDHICRFAYGSWVRGVHLEGFSDEQLLRGLGDKPVAVDPGKLFMKYEKSGKVRLVAAPDYYTQLAMQPVGNWLFSILNKLPADCTYDQRKAIPKIAQWQMEGRTVYSFDHSSCTDLFPVDMQSILLEKRFDKPLAESVQTVLTDRTWKVTMPKSLVSKQLKWAVGQPLGVYASWPLMAVTHHMLVQYASWRCTGNKLAWKPFRDYAICGDDVVIGSMVVAQSYVKLVRDLGMKINMSKSHISGGRTGITPISEFAKITVWNGQPLYEVRPNQVLASVHDWRVSPTLLWELRDKTRFNLSLAQIKRLIDRYFRHGKRYLDFLATAPHSLGGLGFRDDQSLITKFLGVIKTGTEIHPFLHYLASRVRSRMLYLNKRTSLTEDSIVLKLDQDVMSKHPYIEYIKYLSNKLRDLDMSGVKVPSTSQIAADLIKDGWGYYKTFLTGQDGQPGPVPIWDKDSGDRTRRCVNTWARVLADPLRFDHLADAALCLALSQGTTLCEDAIEIKESLTLLQLQRVVEALDALKT